jgi:carbamoyltransferase
LKSREFNEIFVPPFPNDTGCSYGSAAMVACENGEKLHKLTSAKLGPKYTDSEIKSQLDLLKCDVEFSSDICQEVAIEISRGSLVGWFQERMEVGPRALGARSILANPCDANVKDRINKYVKFREDFRPFAPSVIESAKQRYFDINQKSPFMNFIADVMKPDVIPGVTHVDHSARVHTVDDEDKLYASLLRNLEEINGHPIVLNTSFNYMGQPIVCDPREAVYTFYGTGLDVLAIGNWIIRKSKRGRS